MPGVKKEFPTSSESDVSNEVTKEIKFDFKKTDAIPNGNGKSKVLKSKLEDTASFSGKSKFIKRVLESNHDDMINKVNCHPIV